MVSTLPPFGEDDAEKVAVFGCPVGYLMRTFVSFSASGGEEAALEYDPTSWETQEDPYPVYRWLRDEAPVYRNERMGFWALSRFEDVWDATLDWKRFTSTHGPTLEKQPPNPLPVMISLDPPQHTRVRALVSKAFTPKRVAEMEPVVRRLTQERLAGLEPGMQIDLFEQLASSMPMDVISTMLGVPRELRDRVRHLTNAFMLREPGELEMGPRQLKIGAELYAIFGELIAARRRAPEDDLLSALIAAELADESGRATALSDAELLGFCMLLGSAGHETTARLICNSAVTLARHPDQRAALAADPALLPNAVEEMLRYDPPSQVQGRWTTCDVTLHGVTIPEDVRMLLLTGAASRDPREYEAPDRFDVHRRIERHLSFGYGQHLCLGKSLARQECRVAFEELLARFPGYEVDESNLVWAHNNNVRGYAKVPVRL
jgi:cytochrome P450